jgi:Na+/melibiose symporter-like transporter
MRPTDSSLAAADADADAEAKAERVAQSQSVSKSKSKSRLLSENRDFRWFWYGQAISNLGDGFAMVALPLLVLDATNSVAQMGFVTALAFTGQIAMSLFSGLLQDRFHRRRLMLATDLARMVLYASLPLAWSWREHRMLLIYIVATLGAALGNLFMVGQVAAVSNLVEREQLSEANSRQQATTALAYVIGPMLAGVVCSRFGTATALWIDASSFLVSAISLALVRFGRDQIASSKREQTVLRELLGGYRFLFGDPWLFRMILFMSAVNLLASAGVGAAVVDLFVFHLRNELQQGSGVVGMCLGTASVGALIGALLSPRLRRRWGFPTSFFGGTALQAVGLLVGGLFPWVSGTILAGMLWSMGLSLRAVSNISLRQERTPDALLGRVAAAAWTTSFVAAGVGAVLVTHAATSVGAAHTIAGIGLVLGVVAVVGRATWLALPEHEDGRISS